MENKPFYKSTWFRVIVLVFGIILLVRGVYTLITPKIPAGFGTVLQQIGNSITGISATLETKLPQSLSGLKEKEDAKDYTGAAKIVGNTLAVVNDLTSKINLFKKQISEFQSLANRVSDKSIKEISLKLADLLKQLAAHLETAVNLEKQLLEPTKKYYEDLAAGKLAKAPTLNEISQKISDEGKAVADLTNQIVTTVNELSTKILGTPVKK